MPEREEKLTDPRWIGVYSVPGKTLLFYADAELLAAAETSADRCVWVDETGIPIDVTGERWEPGLDFFGTQLGEWVALDTDGTDRRGLTKVRVDPVA